MVKTQKITVSILVILLVPHQYTVPHTQDRESYREGVCYLNLQVVYTEHYESPFAGAALSPSRSLL
jgi:hypothetical protein